MKLVISQEDGTLLLNVLHEAIKDDILKHKSKPESSPWIPLYSGLTEMQKTYKKYGFGFVSFEANPGSLYDIKHLLIKLGHINSPRKRSMIMRVDESLSLYYKKNPSSLT